MDWINKYLASEHLQQFQSVVDAILKDKNYRSWIGLNFDGSDLYSVKFYYTWYRPLTKSEIKRLLFFGSSDDYNHDYKKVSLDNALKVEEAGSGFTFVLKLDINQNPTYGYYFKQVFDKSDLFFNLPETKLFLKKGGDINQLDRVKNFGMFYSPKKVQRQKNYYYIDHQLYKSIIASEFGDPIISTAPVIEYAVGDGHRQQSANKLSKRKVVVYGDFDRLTHHYMQRWNEICYFTQSVSGAGYQIFCPGIYGDKKCKSIYVYFPKGNNRVVETLLETLLAVDGRD